MSYGRSPICLDRVSFPARQTHKQLSSVNGYTRASRQNSLKEANHGDLRLDLFFSRERAPLL